RSLINSAAMTSPAWANKICSSSWVVDLGKLPTCNFTSVLNTAFSRMMTAVRDAANPVMRVGGMKTPHKSSYWVLSDTIPWNAFRGRGRLYCWHFDIKLFQDCHQACTFRWLGEPTEGEGLM